MIVSTNRFTQYFTQDDIDWIFPDSDGALSIRFLTDESIKVSYYTKNPYHNPCISCEGLSLVDASLTENATHFIMKRKSLTLSLHKQTGVLTIHNLTHTLSVNSYEFLENRIHGNLVNGSKVTFSKLPNEAFYGLGQHQDGVLNHAGKTVDVFHNYKAKGGETIGIPFLLSSMGYGIIMNTLCQSKVSLGTNITWQCDCVKDISFIVIMTEDYRHLYQDFRSICGIIPMPLKSSLGFIQCKQRYQSQAEITDVANTYQAKNYPLDMLVVDWFHWKTLGDMSLDPVDWPTPAEMTQAFNAQQVDTMISVWPRFMKESTHYNFLAQKGWFMKDDNGDIVYGTPDDQRGALIDTTNPDCGKWFWQTIKENYASQGFCAWWLDENEPDLWPYDFTFFAGKGYEVFNLYPYTHTKAVYDGHRQSLPTRSCILSRSAYLGAQQFGTQFWSSDIYPTWGVLKKQIPTSINFCASGMGYWSSDIGGWQPLPDHHDKDATAVASLLLETQGSSTGVVTSVDYAELYIRWFQFGVFCPIFRTHGTRDENEVWSYGPYAERILVKYLRLRYRLMPYIYSMAYRMHTEGTPMLRGLFLDYGHDPIACTIDDEYLFGDALLVAPVVEQGATSRTVYLPEGNDWFDFFTNKRYTGGQSLLVNAPLDVLPLFVRENCILPLGSDVKNTKEAQTFTYYVYGDGPSTFALYEDDGVSYAYEQGDFTCTTLTYEDDVFSVDGIATKNYHRISG